MALSRTVADWGNNRHLSQTWSDPKRCKHSCYVRGRAQTNQLRELRVERPELELDPLLSVLPPQFALYRHQTTLVRFFLQAAPVFGVVGTIQTALPGNRQVDQSV